MCVYVCDDSLSSIDHLHLLTQALAGVCWSTSQLSSGSLTCAFCNDSLEMISIKDQMLKTLRLDCEQENRGRADKYE